MTALVTGAGSGIGQATARALSAAGARVVVTELPDRLERAEATVSELQRAAVTPWPSISTYAFWTASPHALMWL